MAAPVDRVQLLKLESTALGGQDADAGGLGQPLPIDPQEDGIEVAGIFFQDPSNRDEEAYTARVGNDLVFRDISNPTERTLTEMLAGVATVFELLRTVSGSFTVGTDTTRLLACDTVIPNTVEVGIADTGELLFL